MLTRRQLLTLGALTGSGLFLPASTSAAWAARSRLNPAGITKYVVPLPILPTMPAIAGHPDLYRIAVRQFRQQILPPGLPKTTVWGYGSPAHPQSFASPSPTIEARVGRPVRITWINELVDRSGDFLPHLLPVDPTLHWANPPGGLSGRDHRPTFSSTPHSYTGPVPIVTHLHGILTAEQYDGYPEAWYLPHARNIPAGHATEGSFYTAYRVQATQDGARWKPGSAGYLYDNDQPAGTMWFHDHTLGMTRLNLYAGPIGFYLLRGGAADLPPGILPGPAPRTGDRPGTRYYEIPIAIQDRSFHTDGSLSYPDPDGSNHGCYADTMVANGVTWPVLRVEPRRYRLRLLNACNSRYLKLKIVTNPLAHRPARPALPLWQIGTDGGFLPTPVRLGQLPMASAERADIIVDFTGLTPGTEFYLINEAPDGPMFGTPAAGNPTAEARTTGQVMKFVVVPLTGADTSEPPAGLTLPAHTPFPRETTTRKVSLNEIDPTGHHQALLGTLSAAGRPVPLDWHDPVTETPRAGATEVWEIHNFTGESHPVHLHNAQFEVLDRQAFWQGTRSPEPWETGLKDTVVTHPSEVTRVKSTFGRAGRYVWHCHNFEHEDNAMMRPLRVI